MLRACAVLLIFTVLADAKSIIEGQTTGNTTLGIRRDYAVLANYDEIPFVTSICNPTTSTFYGNGMAVTAHWVLVRARDAKTVSTLTENVFIYVALTNMADISTYKQHKMKEFVYHPNYVAGDIKFDIALIKVCPRINLGKYAILPASDASYAGNKDVDVLAYQNAGSMGYGGASIYNPWWCSDCTNFDGTKHYLTYLTLDTWTPTVENVASYGIPVMCDNEFYGFMVEGKYYNGNYEFYLYLTQKPDVYKSWVTSNAV